MSDVLTLTAATWDEQIQNNPGPVLVVFSAHWCGACTRFEPTVHSLARTLAGQVTVGTLDVDMPFGRDLARHYHLRGLPTAVLFIAGLERGRTVGGRSEAWLVQWIDTLQGRSLGKAWTYEVGDSEPYDPDAITAKE